MKNIAFFLLFFITKITFAQTIDPSFLPSFTVAGSGWRVIAQPDDKILVSGSYSLVDAKATRSFTRLNADGTLDDSFQYDEQIVETPSRFALQTDGKIIISGNFTNPNKNNLGNILRLLPDGSIDDSFQIIQDTSVNFTALRILPNQKIFAAYSYCVPNEPVNCFAYGVRLYSKDGEQDASFPSIAFTPNHSGSSNSSIQAIGVQSDNALIVAGTDLELDTAIQTVYRFDSTGKIDPAFDPTLPSLSNFTISDMALLPDGSMGFISGGQQYVTILDSLGNEIVSEILINEYSAIQATKENSFLIVGEKVVNIFPDGRIFQASSFGVNQSVRSTAAQSDGVIILGSFDEINREFIPGIGKYMIDNTGIPRIDVSFKGKIFKAGLVNSIVLQADGKIVAGGNFDFVNGQQIHHLVRLNPDGSIDPTFNLTNTNTATTINRIKALSDGTLVITSRYNDRGIGTPLNGLSVLDKDGNYLRPLPLPFEGSRTSAVYLVIDPTDKIYAGQSLAYCRDNDCGQVLNSFELDGLSTVFSTNYNERFIDGLGRYNGLLLQPDRHLLIYGHLLTYDGSDTTSIIRALPSGERDLDFNTDLPLNFYVSTATIADVNKFIVAGGLASDRRFVSSGVYQLGSDGTIEKDFSMDFGRSDNPVYSIRFLKQLSNDLLLVNGNFDWYQNMPIPSGKLLMTTSGELVMELLPDMGAITIEELHEVEPNTYYVAGEFVNPLGGSSLMKIQFNTVNTSTELVKAPILSIFPNPVASTLYLNMDKTLFKDNWFYDIWESGSGRIVQQGQIEGNSSAAIQLSFEHTGHYQIRLTNGKEVFIQAFIK